ncbi:MAG TPA: hypothetical protein VK421_06105 [Pyrinomonadaceae bacterium]|nr:hypothetical protein [Pyrinomonadaceae bacterium]
MSSDYWKEVLTTAKVRLSELRARRDELDAEREEVNLEIVQLEQVVTNLSPLVAERAQSPLIYSLMSPLPTNLADACREVLRQVKKYMTPIEIRNTLAASGYDLSQHNNPLASIHGILKRLAESGEVEALTHDLKGTMYSWKSTGGVRVPGSTPSSGTPYDLLPQRPAKPGHRADPPPAEGRGPLRRLPLPPKDKEGKKRE